MRCAPWSGLTNRLSTSHERQKGFIPESPERANRLRKCSLRGRHSKAIRPGMMAMGDRGGESEIFIPSPRRATATFGRYITLAMPWALISYSRSPIAARIKGLDKPFRAPPPPRSSLFFPRLICPRKRARIYSGTRKQIAPSHRPFLFHSNKKV